MPYAFTLTTAIPASAQEIYDAWLDSLAHCEMTGGEADMSDEIAAEVSAWDGYITGRNLELIPGERIVQSWRTTQFADEHEDLIITLTFEEADDGTLMTLAHSNVPDEQTSYELGGWQEYYFDPMRKVLWQTHASGSGGAPSGGCAEGQERCAHEIETGSNEGKNNSREKGIEATFYPCRREAQTHEAGPGERQPGAHAANTAAWFPPPRS